VARDARIATAGHLRTAAVAHQAETASLAHAHELWRRHLRAEVRAPRFLLTNRRLDKVAATALLGGSGLAPPFPTDVGEAARGVLDRRAADLDAATLYVLSPPMCDVVIAAAQTLSLDDLALLDEDDPPSPTGMLMLPHPILVRTVSGDLSDDRAYVWTAPVEIITPARARKKTQQRWGVRYTAYQDGHGPVRPDSFRDLAATAAAERTPLPPLLPDNTQTFPFRQAITDRHRAAAANLADRARSTADERRDVYAGIGMNDGDQVDASFDYHPGDEIDDHDDQFALRFLYAFWRLCRQDIAQLEDAPAGHSAQVIADRAGVPAQVRVATLRPTRRAGTAEPGGTREWQHQWVVRMHKVRQWYPSENRHKILYRGPYIKGPADKPLLGGEVVRSLHRP
jgi:hypothetical protein